jgi:hypothetical protein
MRICEHKTMTPKCADFLDAPQKNICVLRIVIERFSGGTSNR